MEANAGEETLSPEQFIDPRLLQPVVPEQQQQQQPADAFTAPEEQDRQSVPRTKSSWRLAWDSKNRRFGRAYTEDYRLLLNSEILEVNSTGFDDRIYPSRVSWQFGASLWNQQEIETLYNVLAKKGTNAVKHIAATIGSKSEIEVSHVLHILKEASRQIHYLPTGQRTGRRGFLRLDNVPAAVELSESCCEALDRAAESIAWDNEKLDARDERKRNGKYWLLDRAIAETLERAYEREEKNEAHDSSESEPSEDGTDLNEVRAVDPNEEEGPEATFDADQDAKDRSQSEPNRNRDQDEQIAVGTELSPRNEAHGQGLNEGLKTKDAQVRASEQASEAIAESQDEVPEDDLAMLNHWPEARLLNAINWIELSENWFMAQVPENRPVRRGRAKSWHSLAYGGETPSIYHTAFSDFQNLVVTVTRRLVQVAITEAYSRIRQTSSFRQFERDPSRVTADPVTDLSLGDVQNAIQLLGMPSDSRKILSNTPRKCNLRVYNKDPHSYRIYNNYEYADFAVQHSSKKMEFNEARQMVDAMEMSDDPRDMDSTSEESSQDDNEERSTEPVERSGRAPISGKRKESPVGDAEFEMDAEAYIEAYDKAETAKEEARMWEVLGHEPPKEITAQKKSINIPTKKRSYVEACVEPDWRELIDYRAEWETYGDHVINRTDFMATGLRLKKRRAKRALTRSLAERKRQWAQASERQTETPAPDPSADDSVESVHSNSPSEDDLPSENLSQVASDLQTDAESEAQSTDIDMEEFPFTVNVEGTRSSPSPEMDGRRYGSPSMDAGPYAWNE
ncbi:MAG: hypothetical protein M1820_004551 [Bogoriella megaspora]|nr:MAG: hypothetical protein M1820_004551 [Bogoriella megaspora]